MTDEVLEPSWTAVTFDSMTEIYEACRVGGVQIMLTIQFVLVRLIRT